MNKPNKSKRYVCIAKVGNHPDGSAHCIKHRLDDLVKYVAFLDEKFPSWRWFNVYCNRGDQKSQQLASFTCYQRPTSRYLA